MPTPPSTPVLASSTAEWQPFTLDLPLSMPANCWRDREDFYWERRPKDGAPDTMEVKRVWIVSCHVDCTSESVSSTGAIGSLSDWRLFRDFARITDFGLWVGSAKKGGSFVEWYTGDWRINRLTVTEGQNSTCRVEIEVIQEEDWTDA